MTLSIEEVLREAKLVAGLEGRNLSSLVEEYLESLVASRWLERLAASIGVERLEPTSEDEIPSQRPGVLTLPKLLERLGGPVRRG